MVSFVQQKQAVDPERAMIPKKILSGGRFRRMPMNSKDGTTICGFFKKCNKVALSPHWSISFEIKEHAYGIYINLTSCCFHQRNILVNSVQKSPRITIRECLLHSDECLEDSQKISCFVYWLEISTSISYKNLRKWTLKSLFEHKTDAQKC